MSDNTIIQQGFFTSTGAAVNISLRSGIDWMKVYNTTVAAANQTTAIGVEYYWQKGFPAGAKWEYLKSNATNAANLSQYATSGGFTYVNSAINVTGVIQATITAISTASIPVVTNTGTNGLSAGDVVRLTSITGAPQLGGIDFTVGLSTLSTSTFSLDYAAQLSVAGTTGSFTKINFQPLYYPRHRTISAITSSGVSSLVTTTVAHGYLVGQQVRMSVTAACGMVEMNGLQGTITVVNSNGQFTIDIDSSSFTAFAYPLAANVPFSPAQVTPIGENTPVALADGVNILSDATVNQGFIGMNLQAGANSPAGQNNDVIYWVAGKSFSNGL
jgi:hypothetical protein